MAIIIFCIPFIISTQQHQTHLTYHTHAPWLNMIYLLSPITGMYMQDRQRVLMQITQNLCKRSGLNQYGFDLGTIYIPKEDNVRFAFL